MMKEAGRKRERERETRSYGFEVIGGSEPIATWKKTPGKMEATRMAGEEVEMERRVVKVRDTARRCQRRSWQWDAFMPERKVNEDGNSASKGMLSIPWWVDAGKSCWVPAMLKTPQPPYRLVMTPAWMADAQMKESER